jgi:ABC-type Fe3+ transport system substrate-binding protein
MGEKMFQDGPIKIVVLTLIWSLLSNVDATRTDAQPLRFKQVLVEAKKETTGNFVIWASNPRDDKTWQILVDTFAKKYGLGELKFERLPLHPRDTVARIVAETRAGRSGPDVVFGSHNSLSDIDEAGLLEAYDWVAAFSEEFPTIKEAAVERVPVELKGKWVALFDATRSFIFNTQQLKAGQVPDLIENLSQPQWSRKFIMSNTGSSPWDLFVLRWGEDRTINAMKKVMSNKPIYKKGTPAVNNAVAAGEAPVGFGSIHEAERLKAKGAPVDWKTYGLEAPGDYIPVLPQGLLLTRKSQHKNLARLFIAWFAMDGIAIAEKLDFSFRVSHEMSPLNKLIKERAPNAKVLAPASRKEFEIHDQFGETASKIIAAGLSGG